MRKIIKYPLIFICVIFLAIFIFHIIPHWKCYSGGGIWLTCANGCGDKCNPQVCSMLHTPCCSCGDSKCWDGERCVPHYKYIDVGINCKNDADCDLVPYNYISCSACPFCFNVDYSREHYIAVNAEKFEEYLNKMLKKKCPDFYECKIINFSSDVCVNYTICSDCEPLIINDNYKAKCVKNMCIKVKKS